jgi:glycosyltransferase involved in cell wall biosynthesis
VRSMVFDGGRRRLAAGSLDPGHLGILRLLIVHNEANYFAGAEKMLGYYLEGLHATDCAVAVAHVEGARVREVIPESVQRLELPEKQRFSLGQLSRQVKTILRSRESFPFDLIHAWTARDWELASVAGLLASRPVVGTLHDHPRASFISPQRQQLMRWCATWGLRKVICVSGAVRDACVEEGYPVGRLFTIHNGLPTRSTSPSSRSGAGHRIGFLGSFSERKGLRGFFSVLDLLNNSGALDWEAVLAGGAQDPESEALVARLKVEYSQRPWWSRVHWAGWVSRPADFLASVDLLMVPSSAFDPFPTVLLEAGRARVPVVASKVGGVAEIVEDGVTGLLFEPGRWELAARMVRQLLESSAYRNALGDRAFDRVSREFNIAKMVAEHQALYSTLSRE